MEAASVCTTVGLRMFQVCFARIALSYNICFMDIAGQLHNGLTAL
jgi:hypothetical protein